MVVLLLMRPDAAAAHRCSRWLSPGRSHPPSSDLSRHPHTPCAPCPESTRFQNSPQLLVCVVCVCMWCVCLHVCVRARLDVCVCARARLDVRVCVCARA